MCVTFCTLYFPYHSIFNIENEYRPDGTLFQAPSQPLLESEMPKKGDIVTFTYDNLWNRTIPVNAEVIRVRNDLFWRDIIRDFIPPGIIINYKNNM